MRLHSCWLLTPCYDLENFISLESTISRGQAERLWYRRIPEEHSIRAARGKCLACSGISFEKNRQTSCSTVNLMLSAMCCLRCSLSCKCRGTSLCTPFGATWHFLTEGSMEQTLLWGRWVSSSTARIYFARRRCSLEPPVRYRRAEKLHETINPSAIDHWPGRCPWKVVSFCCCQLPG